MNFWNSLRESTASAAYLFQDKILLASVTKEGGKVKLPHIEQLDPNVKQFDIAKSAVAVIPAKESLVRTLKLSLTKKRDIESVLPFEIEPLIPFSETESLYDYKVTSQFEGESQLALYITKKETVERAVSECKKAKLFASTVTLPSGALTTLTKEQGFEKEPLATIFLDEEMLLTILFENGYPVAQHVAKRDETLPIEQEIIKALLSLSKSKKLSLSGNLYFIGVDPSAASKVGEATGGTPLFSKELFGLELPLFERFAIPIGAALGSLQSEELPNFQKEALSYDEFLLSYKKPLIFLLVGSLLLTLGILLVGESLADRRLSIAKESYSHLLSILETPYSQQERRFEGEDEIRPLSALSSDEMTRRLFIIESNLFSNKERIELYPDVPRVSDLLALLTKSSQVTGSSRSAFPPINLKSFNYSMVKRPDIKHRHERYRVKVDLEFTALNATAAREFHDFLLAPNEFVDRAQDVKWSTSGDLYRASFFLKNRAPSLKEAQ